MSEEVEINSEKSFEIELSTNKDNSYKILFTLENYIEIAANQINDIVHKSYSSKYSLEEIKDNEYFLQFNTLNEIFEEIKDRIYNNKITLKENENGIIINAPLPQNNEIIFELKPNIKNNNENYNKLIDIIIKLNEETNNIKNEIANLKKNETELKNEVNQLKDENIQLKNENILLKNNESKLENEVIELKEKLNILWEENKLINNLDSKIIIVNEKYNETLKYWINPLTKIKAKLLYRLSENGDKFSTFHKLCDNKGPTLTLFHVNDGNIVGIYTPLSWDSTSHWKNDINTFIFNLNKNKKYKKLKNDYSIYCNISYGPYTADLECSDVNSMRTIKHWANLINEYYDKGSEILPSNNQIKEYELIDSEVYKIIIE